MVVRGDIEGGGWRSVTWGVVLTLPWAVVAASRVVDPRLDWWDGGLGLQIRSWGAYLSALVCALAPPLVCAHWSPLLAAGLWFTSHSFVWAACSRTPAFAPAPPLVCAHQPSILLAAGIAGVWPAALVCVAARLHTPDLVLAVSCLWYL